MNSPVDHEIVLTVGAAQGSVRRYAACNPPVTITFDSHPFRLVVATDKVNQLLGADPVLAERMILVGADSSHGRRRPLDRPGPGGILQVFDPLGTARLGASKVVAMVCQSMSRDC